MVGNTTSPEAKSNTDSIIQSRLARKELVAGRTTVEARSLSHLSIVLGRDRFQIVAVSLLFALDAIHGFCLCHEHREVFPTYNMNPTHSIASRSFPIGSGKRQLQNKFTLRFADPSLAPKMRPALALLFW